MAIGNPRIWEPVEEVDNGYYKLYAGTDGIELDRNFMETWGNFSWPQDGYEYAVCRRRPLAQSPGVTQAQPPQEDA